MNYEDDFKFLIPGKLVDRDLELILVEKCSADALKGYVPAYGFEMRHVNQNTNIGNISLRIGNNENIEKYAGHIGYNVAPEYRI